MPQNHISCSASNSGSDIHFDHTVVLSFFCDSLQIYPMDSLNNNMTEMIQQSALSIAKQTKKEKNPKISSPTRALMKKRREMIENARPPETT